MSTATERWEVVVGLEVHAELATRSKLFCGSPNAFGSEPNTNICPICLGLPGSLPVLNEYAVELAIRIGVALGSEIRPSVFHRKNYFYPDMPKDYQISQYDEPINVGGRVTLADGSVVGIVRAHIEEDTGKTTHVGGTGRIHTADYALVDYNRAGVPLVEIVSEPDIRSADQARAYVTELRSILVATGASDGRMEEGSLRVDANVSVRRPGDTTYGTRCEVKNLNSLRSLGRAIEYEFARQVEILESGGTVAQETRHFNEDDGTTSTLRSKEEAFDYRYFAEPDLVPLAPGEDLIAKVSGELPPLPAERRERLGALVRAGDGAAPADQLATVVELGLDELVSDAIGLGADRRLALARAANEAAANPDAARKLPAAAYSELIGLESSGTLSATQVKTVLKEMFEAGGQPTEIARRLGFEALDASELDAAIEGVIAEFPDEWARFVAGEDKVESFLTGQVMRRTRGRANGKVVAESFARRRG
jgi:aspartyl-tRNA(Asn)/glutamyl-tRNA(Gln) amidotransferase subunit B